MLQPHVHHWPVLGPPDGFSLSRPLLLLGVPGKELADVIDELLHQAQVALQVEGPAQLLLLGVQLVEPLVVPVLVPPSQLAQPGKVQQELVERDLNPTVSQCPPKLTVLLKQ